MPLGTLVDGKQTESKQQLFCFNIGNKTTPPQLLTYSFNMRAPDFNRMRPL